MEEELIKKKSMSNKRIVLTILSIVLGLGITLGAIYFMYFYKDQDEASLTTGLIRLNFNDGENNINITTLPVLDEVGLQNTPYTFTLTNASPVPINAKLYLVDNSSTIDLRAVKYALYINNELVKKDFLTTDLASNDLLLYTYNNMPVNGTINCKVVFWVDYYYTPSKSNEAFSAKLKAEGESFDVIANNQ